MRLFSSALVAAGALAFAGSASAITIGDIQVCYNCSNNFPGGGGVQDGPTFEIQNTSAAAIFPFTFTVNGDTFHDHSALAGGSNVVLIPGVSNDGGFHAAGAFWFVTGSIRDTSDVGPNSNSTPFVFFGLWKGLFAMTGVFTPATSVQALSNDGTVAGISFLGGPGENDGPCNNCYGPDIVATITATPLAVPEPASLAVLGTALLGLCGVRRRRRAS